MAIPERVLNLAEQAETYKSDIQSNKTWCRNGDDNDNDENDDDRRVLLL